MDFIDQLRQFSARVTSIKDLLLTEEATKNSLILPFFQLLGYDVFNPIEFLPEFTADVGIKKGEKVDYAIFLNGKPAILIECKCCSDTLEKHDSQLFRYFATSPAKFGILTNGIVYKFYTDLDEPNKMDLTPFLEFNLLDIKETLVPELRRFTKETIDIDAAFSAASELKYTNLIKLLIHKQRTTPDDAFVSFVLGEVYPGRRTQAVVDRFLPIIKKAFNAYIGDTINDTLKSAMMSHEEPPTITETPVAVESLPEEQLSRIDTTTEEIEAYIIIKALLHGVMPPEKVVHKDTESYFGILYDGNIRKWICRLKLEAQKKTLYLPDGTKFSLNDVNDLFQYAPQIMESAKRFIA